MSNQAALSICAMWLSAPLVAYFVPDSQVLIASVAMCALFGSFLVLEKEGL